MPDGFDGKFADYNLYQNRFSEMLALVAYTGAGQSREAFTTSPELTTNGMLPKAWRFIENDGIYLYKGGSTVRGVRGGNPIVNTMLRSMLVFDALTYNEDRHFGNFGLLRDNHTGKIKAPAPLFDNGLSLLCYTGQEEIGDFKKPQEYAATRTNPYRLSFEEVCAAVMGAKQKEQLSR